MYDRALLLAAVAGAAVAAGVLAARRAPPWERWDETTCRRVALAAAGAHALFFATTGVLSHLAFRTYAYDLGVFSQTVWLYGQGELPFSTIKGVPMLGVHFSPVLALFAPLTRIAPAAALLIAAEAVACAAAAPVLFAAASRRTGQPRTALALTLAYLLHPWVGNAHLHGFHEVSLAVPLIFLAYLSHLRGSMGMMCASLAAASLVKEDVPLWIAGMGAAVALSGNRRRGLVVCLAGLCAFAVIVGLLMPAFRDGRPSEFTAPGAYYGWFASPEGRAALGERPQSIVARLVSGERWTAQATVFLPIVLLPLLGGAWTVPLAVPVAETALSDHFRQYTLGSHYALPILALAFPAACEGWARGVSLVRRLVVPDRAATALAAALLAASAAANYALCPELLNLKRCARAPEAEAAARLIVRIPPSAGVAASDPFVPHLAERRTIVKFHNWEDAAGCAGCERALLGPAEGSGPPPGWELESRDGPVRLYRRTR